MRHATKYSRDLLAFVGIGLLAMGVVGCTPGFEGEYADPAKEEIVDDRWNETDARRTAESMVKAMLERSWLERYKKNHGGERPIVVVSDIENRTDEHIDVDALREYIQDELINSGGVRFVNKSRRKEILEELDYQHSGRVRESDRAAKGRQIGAGYLLSGAVSSQVHSRDGLKTVTYQTALRLTNIETSELEWSKKYQIKKRFRRSSVGL